MVRRQQAVLIQHFFLSHQQVVVGEQTTSRLHQPPLHQLAVLAVVATTIISPQVRLELQTKVLLVETAVPLPPDLVVAEVVLAQLEAMALLVQRLEVLEVLVLLQPLLGHLSPVVAVAVVVQKVVLAVLHQVAAVLVLVTLLLLPGRQTLAVAAAAVMLFLSIKLAVLAVQAS